MYVCFYSYVQWIGTKAFPYCTIVLVSHKPVCTFLEFCVLFCICFGQNKQASEEDGGSQGDGIEYFTLFFSLQAAFNTYVWCIIGGTPDKGTKSNPMVVSVIPQKCM